VPLHPHRRQFHPAAAQALREGSRPAAPLPPRRGRRFPFPARGGAVSARQALRIGTRASALALWQARHVEGLVRAQPGAPPVELVHIKTEGDVQSDVPLWQTGGRAFFTKGIDRALIPGTVDVAVHSLKDLATQIEPGIELAATLPREDSRDALVSRSGAAHAALPPGPRIGTRTLRRRAFLARARADAVLVELRGN